ncbi:MAG: hypothetical protein KAI24_07950, partial [Planctomycetes bacterium]|nr:hypothetical protein [Planctomycetota bacterium]
MTDCSLRLLSPILALCCVPALQGQCQPWAQFVAQGLGGGVRSVERLPNGDIVYAGQGTWNTSAVVNGPAVDVARWDGTAFHPMGPGFDQWVSDLQVLPSGDLLAAGSFTTVGTAPAPALARWDGGQWHALANPFWSVGRMTIGPNGDLYACGVLANVTPTTHSIRRWDGNSWHLVVDFVPRLGNSLAGVAAILVRDVDDVVVAGSFDSLDGQPFSRIAHWTGAQFQPLANGIQGDVNDLCELASGELVAAGDFHLASGTTANNIARWDGTGWSPLAQGTNSTIYTLLPLSGTELLVGGYFTLAGGQQVYGLARWDGSSWD